MYEAKTISAGTMGSRYLATTKKATMVDEYASMKSRSSQASFRFLRARVIPRMPSGQIIPKDGDGILSSQEYLFSKGKCSICGTS